MNAQGLVGSEHLGVALPTYCGDTPTRTTGSWWRRATRGTPMGTRTTRWGYRRFSVGTGRRGRPATDEAPSGRTGGGYLDDGAYLDESGLTERLSVGGQTVGVVRNGVFTTVATDSRGSVLAEPTGQAQMGLRDYDPETGRWTTSDPKYLEQPGLCVGSPLSCSLQTYVASNPLTHVDPDGLDHVYHQSTGVLE